MSACMNSPVDQYLFCTFKGNQVAWDMEVWDTKEVDIEYREMRSMCQPDIKLRKLVVSTKISYNVMRKACDDLNGVMPTPFTKKELMKSNKDFRVRHSII